MISSGTDDIVGQAIFMPFTQRDMTNLHEIAASGYEELHDFLVTVAGGLNDKGRSAILDVALGVLGERWYFLRRRCQVSTSLYQSFDNL